MIENVDTNANGAIDFNEFIDMIDRMMLHMLSKCLTGTVMDLF